MKNLLFVLVACAAFGAQAKWSYDSTAKRLVETTDADGAVTNWVLAAQGSSYGEESKRVKITGYVSGKGDMDFTDFFTDTDGYRLTEVGVSAFNNAGSTNMTSFIGPDVIRVNVSAFCAIKVNNAMSNDTLRIVRLSDDLDYVGGYAFAYQYGLEEFLPTNCLKLAKLDGQGCFNFCVKMKGDWNLPLITSFENSVFGRCAKITSVRIPAVTELKTEVFSDCKALSGALDLPLLTSMGNSCFMNTRITSVSAPNLTGMGKKSFGGCSKLEGDLSFPLLKSIPNEAFLSCSKMKSVSAPQATSVGEAAFRSANGMTNLVLSSQVRAFGANTFYGCSSLTNITPTEFACVSNMLNDVFNGTKALAVDLSFPALTNMGQNAFYQCGLTGFDAPQLKTLPATGNNGYHFYGCANLKTFNAPQLLEIRNFGFQYCTSLETAYVPSVTKLYGTGQFDTCSSLKKVVFGGGLTKLPKSTFFGIPSTADICFLGEAPTIENQSLVTADSKPGRILAYHGKEKQSWLDAVAPNAVTYESAKSRADFPGRACFGVAITGRNNYNYYSYVISYPPPGMRIIIR